MVASVSLNNFLKDEADNEKIINFSSAILRFVSNIPNAIFSIISIPFLLLLIPVLNLVLASAIRKTTIVVKNIDKDIQGMNYEGVKEIYDLLSGLDRNSTLLNNDSNFLTKGLESKLIRLLALHNIITKKLELALFVDCAEELPLTEKEKEGFDRLNDIWGDDDDGSYGKLTFNQLKKA